MWARLKRWIKISDKVMASVSMSDSKEGRNLHRMKVIPLKESLRLKTTLEGF